MCLLCLKFSSENNDIWNFHHKAMQETAGVCNELHPTVLCQNNHCQVVLKDVSHAAFTSPTKFKSSFCCNFMNSSLNGGFHTRDSNQIIHNYAQVKDKLSRDVIRKRFIENNIHNKLMLSSHTTHQLSASNNLSDKHNIPVHQKRDIGSNGDVDFLQDSSTHNFITNRFSRLKNNVKNRHAQPDCNSYSDDFVRKIHARKSALEKPCFNKPYHRHNCLNSRVDITSTPNCTSYLVSQNKQSSASPKKIDGSQEPSKCKSEHSVLNHRKHVKLKESTEEDISDNDDGNSCTNDTDEHMEDDCDMQYALRSLQRLPFLQNWNENKISINSSITKKLVELADTCFDVRINRKQSIVACQSKNMRSSPESCEYEQHFAKNLNDSQSKHTESGVCLCEWQDCEQRFDSVESLTKHVKIEHIQSAKHNDVFICLWDNCKFSNQPSCSFKWLQKHVIGHCDLKPFKCVIFGCDMTFVTQNGLARHVPTHFNENRVRRACVITSEAVSKELQSTKTKGCLPPASPATSADTDESRSVDLNRDLQCVSRLERFVQQNLSKSKFSGGFV